MNDILFGNNNSKVITKLSKRYFKKNKVRNLAALLAIILTAFLFTSITSLAFNMASSIQLSLQMQKGSKADGTLGYMTEEQYEQLVNSDFVEQAGHRHIICIYHSINTVMLYILYRGIVGQKVVVFIVPKKFPRTDLIHHSVSAKLLCFPGCPFVVLKLNSVVVVHCCVNDIHRVKYLIISHRGITQMNLSA